MASSSQRARHSPVVQRWFQQDELPAPRALDDSGWQPHQWPAKVAIASLAALPLLLWVDSDYAAPTAFAGDDQTSWQAPITNLPNAQATTFWHQDEIPDAAPVTAPSDGFQSHGQRERVHTKFQHWYTQDELPTVTARAIDDESAYRPFGLPSTPTVIVWAEDESMVPQPSALTVDELYWQAPVIQRVAPNLQVWQVDDIITRFLLVDEDAWQAAITPARIAQREPWVDDEIIPQAQTFALDESSWDAVGFAAKGAPPVTAVWQQQDERVTPPTPLLVDLDFLVVELRSYQPPPDLRLFQDDGNFTQAPIYTYTHDSRERVGGKHERVKKGRIGPRNTGGQRQ